MYVYVYVYKRGIYNIASGHLTLRTGNFIILSRQIIMFFIYRYGISHGYSMLKNQRVIL